MTCTFGDYAFEYICPIEPTDYGLMPQNRYSNPRGLPLHPYGSGTFCEFRIPRGRRSQGMYVLTKDGEMTYIGECENLSNRHNAGYGQISPRNCYKGGQETNCRINRLIAEATQSGHVVELWFHPTLGLSRSARRSVERQLRDRCNPPWNLRRNNDRRDWDR